MASKLMVVRTIEQAAAWIELDGQISDGYWENRKGSDWQTWCAAEIRVAAEGEEVGRQFFTTCDKFNLLAPDLTRVIWKRMIGIVRIGRRFGLDVAQSLEHDVDCDTGRISWGDTERYMAEEKDPNGYWHRKHAQLANLDRAAIDACLEDEYSYTNKDLRRDLKELMQTMRTRVRSAEEKAYWEQQKAARLAEDEAARAAVEATAAETDAVDTLRTQAELDAAVDAELELAGI